MRAWLVAAGLLSLTLGCAFTTSERTEVPRASDSARSVRSATVPGTSELRTFDSASLGRPMTYWVYLPPDYHDTSRQYPVLYLLHGLGGSPQQWRDLGMFEEADRLIATGAIAPVLIVLPQGERGYWVDHAGDGPAWGRYTARDLVAEIDGRFRTIAHSTARAIGGISMGGHGAVQLALNHPGTFDVVGAHSIALRREQAAPPFFGRGADFAARDPMTLVQTRLTHARSLFLWLDVGADDPWAAQARRFQRQLAELGIEHEWREWPGAHSGEYWRGHLTDYLRYYDVALGRSADRQIARMGSGWLMR